MSCQRCGKPLVGRQTKYCSRACAVSLHVDLRRRMIKRKAVEYKGGKCERCGYNKSLWALDFHHHTGDKEFILSNMYRYNWESKIKPELDKCILVCRNCHSEIHEELWNGGREEM